jgi:hypothetical protein
LRAAKSDVMSDDSRQKILAGIGLGGAALGVTASVGTVAKSAWPWGKLGAGVAGAGVIAASLALLYTPQKEDSETSLIAPPPVPERISGAGGVQKAPEPNADDVVEPKPEQPASEVAQAVEAVRPESQPEKIVEKKSDGKSIEKPALAAELAALKAAQSSLASGDAASTLRLVRDYRRAFPGGRLKQEATMLEIEALLRLGEREKAERLAEPLLSGQSLYAARIRSLLGKNAP